MTKLIIPNDMYGVTEKDGIPVVGSRKMAENFNKNHDDVLKSIRVLIEGLGEISESEWINNFILSRYKNQQNKFQPEYLLTKKGFTLLAVGFTGKKALRFKVQYINTFEKMERFIKSLFEAKTEFPEFTEAIMASHEEPKSYHFSNEINMINRIVLGMDSKQFKKLRGIDEDVKSIRPYLQPEQIEAIKRLQRMDIGLVLAVSDFQQRKKLLTDYFEKLKGKPLLEARTG